MGNARQGSTGNGAPAKRRPSMNGQPTDTPEHQRLREAHDQGVAWRKWGAYLSERQWGSVREDVSQSGDAWNSFPHDQARSRAYLWGEDGIAGFCDDTMRLCFALAFWNGRDPILKERLFGLTNGEGNHGEDVKEYYFYLDSTPTHSSMRMLYKYPQAAFPYDTLIRENRARSRTDPEFELLDTGVFNEDRYFDITVEYAKASPEDVLIRVEVTNRGPEESTLHVLPHLWFRNTWGAGESAARPSLRRVPDTGPFNLIAAQEPVLGEYFLAGEKATELLFTENETNEQRLYGRPNRFPYVKDGINDYLVQGQHGAVDPQQQGTKAAFHYVLTLAPGETRAVRLRLTDRAPAADPFAAPFEEIIRQRRQEADAFYSVVTPPPLGEDAARLVRQAFAGMLWSKQAYLYEVDRWLEEHGVEAGTSTGNGVRNHDWFHLTSADVISMPDKWEYPWFAAWDLSFHSLALAFVDPDFASEQSQLLLRGRYLHPNGQLPAYEWNFGDVNPPVQAWASLFQYRLCRQARGEKAVEELERAFQKLLLNFTWWINRKDRTGRSVFEGGFLGLDNISVFDRSSPLPDGGCLEQADGTAWMALFAQNMLEISIELALHDPQYEDFVAKFYEHFLWIAAAMDRIGDNQDEMWDEEDGFFYDVLRSSGGGGMRLKVRSLVGLLPLCASTVFPAETLQRLPGFAARLLTINADRPKLLKNICSPEQAGVNGRRLLAVLDERKLRRVLARMLDPQEFLSDYGIRALSRYHLEHPYVLQMGGTEHRVGYLPAESDSGLFGGNSNWRGPIWMPVNALILRALMNLYMYYGNDFKVECPTGSGRMMTLYEVGVDLLGRLSRIFLRDATGRRPVYGGTEKFQNDPHWRDHLLFYEYFHGDNGAGIGASHQTGWTGLIAGLLVYAGRLTADELLYGGLSGAELATRAPRRSSPAVRA